MEKKKLRQTGGWSLLAGLLFLMMIPVTPSIDLLRLDKLTFIAAVAFLALGVVLVIYTRNTKPWD